MMDILREAADNGTDTVKQLASSVIQKLNTHMQTTTKKIDHVHGNIYFTYFYLPFLYPAYVKLQIGLAMMLVRTTKEDVCC